MGNQFSNRTLVIASLVVIASSVALNVIRPKSHWRPSSRHEGLAMPHATRPADDFEVQIMAPDLVASKATTTISFRILNRGEIVTTFGRPVDQAVQVAVARRNSYSVEPLVAFFSTTTGSFSVPVTLPDPAIYRFVIDFLPKSGTPIRRFGDVEVGS
jgi:hypothetical protein